MKKLLRENPDLADEVARAWVETCLDSSGPAANGARRDLLDRLEGTVIQRQQVEDVHFKRLRVSGLEEDDASDEHG